MRNSERPGKVVELVQNFMLMVITLGIICFNTFLLTLGKLCSKEEQGAKVELGKDFYL